MAVVVKHTKVCGGSNDPSKEVSKDAWNDNHVIEGLGTAAEADAADFALAGHNHDANYAASVHSHDYAGSDHNHDGTYATAGHDHDADYAGISHAHSYNDLTDKPSLFSGSYTDLSDKPTLFSGSYDDLTDKPTLGDAASKNVGTASGTVAAGDHTHAGGGAALDAWPVGSVFIAVVSTSPATLLGGGTWSAFGAGRMLVGRDSGDTDFDTAEETGGSKTSSAVVNHTHAVNVTDPGHAHEQTAPTSASGGANRFATDTNASGADTAGNNATQSATTGITATTANPAGGVSSFSLMNPYIVVYMWKRTA